MVLVHFFPLICNASNNNKKSKYPSTSCLLHLNTFHIHLPCVIGLAIKTSEHFKQHAILKPIEEDKNLIKIVIYHLFIWSIILNTSDQLNTSLALLLFHIKFKGFLSESLNGDKEFCHNHTWQTGIYFWVHWIIESTFQGQTRSEEKREAIRIFHRCRSHTYMMTTASVSMFCLSPHCWTLVSLWRCTGY